MTKVSFNGQTFESLDKMPPAIRAQYEHIMETFGGDADRNGIPDSLESFRTSGGSVGTNSAAVQSQKFVVDGKVYDALEELPAELQAKITEALKNTRMNMPTVQIKSQLSVDRSTPRSQLLPPTGANNTVIFVGPGAAKAMFWLLVIAAAVWVYLQNV